MMKDYKLFLVLFLAVIITMGCGDKYEGIVVPDFDNIDEYINENPDSAFVELGRLSSFVDDMDESDKIKYYKYRTLAMNKMYVSLVGEESVMKCVVDYYDKHGSPDEKMDACLLLGSVYRDMGDAPRALEWFDKAITHGEKSADKTQLAKIHGQKADLFIKQRLFEDALVEVDMMKSISQTVGEKSLFVNALSIKSSVEYCLKRYESVINTYNEASDILLNDLRDTVRAAFLATSSISSYLRLGVYDKAKDLMLFCEQRSGLFSHDGEVVDGYESYYLDKGDLCVGLGLMDSSLVYYKKSLDAHELGNVCMSNYKLAKVYEGLGMTDSAFKYAVIACNLSQKYFEELQSMEVQRMMATHDYSNYKRNSEVALLKSEYSRNKTKLVFIVATILIFVLGVFVFKWKRYKEKELELSRLKLLRVKNEVYNVASERAKIQTLLSQKMQELETLRNVINDSKTEANLNRELADLREALSETDSQYTKLAEDDSIIVALTLKAVNNCSDGPVTESQWRELERYIKRLHPMFVSNVLKCIPNINKEHIRILMLMKLNFTHTQISFLMNKNLSTVSNARRRMYEKAHNGSAATAELADEWIKGL